MYNIHVKDTYKLIKKYPQSPPLNTMVSWDNILQKYRIANTGNTFGIHEIEDNEYWKCMNGLIKCDDGTILFDGDRVFYLGLGHEEFKTSSIVLEEKTFNYLVEEMMWNDDTLFFATEELCDEWIEKNSPKYSAQDIFDSILDIRREIKSTDTYIGIEVYHLFDKLLENIVKSEQ